MSLLKAFRSVVLAAAAFAPLQSLMAAPELTRTQEAAYLPRDKLAGLTAYAPGRLSDMISTAYQQGAQFVILGDTDHGSLTLKRVLHSPEILKSAAESGVTDIFIEMGPRHQTWADALISGRMTDEEFARKILETGSFTGLSYKESFDYLRSTFAVALKLAALYDIDVHFVDIDTETKRLTPLDAVKNFRDSTLPAWRKKNVKTANDMAWLVEYGQFEINSSARFHADRELGRRIGDIAQGRKGLIIYGSSHGSYFNDLDESLPGQVIKIDVYPHFGPLNGFTLGFQKAPDDPRYYFDNSIDADPDARRLGEDKPELVFILPDAAQDKGIVYQTVNTPLSLRKAMAPMSFIPSVEGSEILEQARQYWKLPSLPLSWK